MKTPPLESLGRERTVHPHPDHKDRVVKKSRRENTKESPELAFARFFLMKLMHHLLPKNFPDIHLATADGQEIHVNRVQLDELHRIMQQEDIEQHTSNSISLETKRRAVQAERERQEDPRVHSLVRKLRELGFEPVSQDVYGINLVPNGKDEMWFIDTIDPWIDLGSRTIRKRYYPALLEQAIAKLPSAQEQRACRRYLSRMEELFKICLEKNHFYEAA